MYLRRGSTFSALRLTNWLIKDTNERQQEQFWQKSLEPIKDMFINDHFF